MKDLNVLLSAYGCEPGKGSEPGVGWNVARGLAARHNVWVITRANNRPVIEAALAEHPAPRLHFAYYDLPDWAMWWKRGPRGVELYYYLWQLGIYPVARRLHQEIGFDVAHHVTFVRYWRPSLLSLLDAPFVWGPVGGGESAPRSFWKSFSRRGAAHEALRDAARWLGERDPLVQLTARRSAVALATTRETAARLRCLGASRVEVLNESALNDEERDQLRADAPPTALPLRFVSVGRHIHWKGYHLSIRAFAQAGIQDAEYWLIGDGAEHDHLQQLVEDLGMTGQIKLLGHRPRAETLERLKRGHVFVHPSLHDSGGWACPEAMAAGRPVICLDLGGPATQVTAATGIKVPARTPEQTVAALAAAMRRLAHDPEQRARMATAARQRVEEVFNWSRRADTLAEIYARVTQKPAPKAAQAAA